MLASGKGPLMPTAAQLEFISVCAAFAFMTGVLIAVW
jgi:hypothetical protein